jgi:hypothetical protein
MNRKKNSPAPPWGFAGSLGEVSAKAGALGPPHRLARGRRPPAPPWGFHGHILHSSGATVDSTALVVHAALSAVGRRRGRQRTQRGHGKKGTREGGGGLREQRRCPMKAQHGPKNNRQPSPGLTAGQGPSKCCYIF